MNFLGLDDFLKAALREDVGTSDVTTLCCIPENAKSRGRFIAKESGVVCGTEIMRRVFELTDREITLTVLKNDGESVEPGHVIAHIAGPSRGILSGERVALNLLQRMSGIAARTREAVRAVAGTDAKICDTRKCTPGLRVLEKYAVRTGGGHNHRFNLSDGILIKDNHITAAGGIKQAIEAVRHSAPHTLKVEIECETPEQVRQALDAKADIIMLDNMTTELTRECVRLIGGAAVTEASGNMGGRDLREVALTGVDYISVGALTHSVRAMDISLKLYD